MRVSPLATGQFVGAKEAAQVKSWVSIIDRHSHSKDQGLGPEEIGKSFLPCWPGWKLAKPSSGPSVSVSWWLVSVYKS